MRSRALLAPLAAGLLALLGVASSGDPRDAVVTTLEAANAIVRSEGTRNQKLEALNGLAGDLLDSRAMGHRVIGRRLAERPAEEREEFLALFDDLIVRAYLQKLLLFREPVFAYGENETREGATIVHTRILSGRDAYFVDYEMRARGGRWRATDIVIEGVSLTRNYHDQFARILKHQSFEELLERMRRKTRRPVEP
jgi:phospholipid transport system substrate-binding protein